MRLVSRLRRDAGQAMVEYALVLALVAMAATFSLRSIGTDVDDVFDDVAAALAPVGGGDGNGTGAGGNGQGNNGNGNGNGGPSGNDPRGGRGGGGGAGGGGGSSGGGSGGGRP